MSQWLAEITPGLSSSQGCVVHPLKCSQNHRLSPFSFSITFTHKEVEFKGQNQGSKAPLHIKLFLLLMKLRIWGECFEVQIAAKGLGEVLLANTIRVGSSSLRGGYHAGIEQLELLKHKALVYQVNKLGR